jgi:hypothetical protein
MERRDFLKAVAAAGIAASAGSLAVKLNETVKKLWQGTEAGEWADSDRTDIADSQEPKRKVHAWGRSQCRTTHKRQDC